MTGAKRANAAKLPLHYTPMIDELAVDEDMKQHLILKLLEELPHFPMGQA